MKLNNKGYMIIEILVASMIAFGIAYFLFDLTLNLKTKSDNAKKIAVINLDRSILENYIMRQLSNATSIDCDDTNTKLLYESGGKTHYITVDSNNNCFYDYVDNQVNNPVYKHTPSAVRYLQNDDEHKYYTKYTGLSCSYNGSEYTITIDISDTISNDTYDVNLKYIK